MDTSHATPSSGYALFETALGTCGIAWRDRRVAAVALPGAGAEGIRRRRRRATGGMEAEAPAQIARARAAIASLLAGEASDLGDVEVDLGGAGEFDRRVYAVARTIRPGETLTYGEVARRLGDSRLAREVGTALARNPVPLVVPCHRVVAADGTLGGFSAPGGRETKRRLLALERPHAERTPTLFA